MCNFVQCTKNVNFSMFGIQELSTHVKKYIIFNTEYIATSLENVMTKTKCTHINDIEENLYRIQDSVMHKIYRIQYVMMYQKRSNTCTPGSDLRSNTTAHHVGLGDYMQNPLSRICRTVFPSANDVQIPVQARTDLANCLCMM